MDKSKINQTELDYSCSVGKSKINIYNGRLLFNHFDDSINSKNLKMSIAHIYNSHFEEQDTHMGNNWKLNIQQFLYYEMGKYILIDENGVSHDFVMCSQNLYYDTSGLGLILNINNNQNIITDQSGNKYYFENNRIVKKERNYNTTTFEYYQYDENGRLITVYNSKKPNNKFIFEYKDNLLSSIKTIVKGNISFQLNYFYNEFNCLIEIDYLKENICIDKVIIKNENNKMTYVSLLSSKEGFGIEYLGNKVSKISKGLIDISENITITEDKLKITNNVYCNDSKFVGEKDISKKYDYVINGFQENKILSLNNFTYQYSYTIVQNEKNLKMIYYQNEKGYTVSLLEANNGNVNDLRSLEKNPGRSFLNNGIDLESINTRKAHFLSTDYIISTENIMSENLKDIDNYVGKKCNKYCYFNCTFWLKLSQPLNNKKVRLKIVKYSGLDNKAEAYALIDNSAINSWQYVSIPIKISTKEVNFAELKFEDNNQSNTFKIADMRLCYQESSKLCLTNGTDWDYFDNIKEIKYIPIDKEDEYVTQTINDNIYITEKDLQMMYLDRFKKNGNSNITNGYLMYFSNGQIVKYVKKVILSTDTKDFEMNFSSDEYGANSRTNFFYEIKSPDGNMYNYNFLHYFKNKDIDGKKYDCICQISESNKFLKKDSDHKESFTATYFDLYGNLLLEQDEYGVKKSYKYDEYNNLLSKKIFSDETNEAIIYKYTTSDTCDTSLENNCLIKNEYDSNDGKLLKTTFKGNDEDESKEYVISNQYHRTNDSITKTSDNLGAQNNIKYGKNGKSQLILPMDYNAENMYGYEVEYDHFGNPTKYYYISRDGNNVTKKLVQETNINLNNNTMQTVYHRNEQEKDVVNIKLDKYGRTESINENGKITTFKRQNLWESQGDSEVEEMYDPYSGLTHKYEYDFFNNLSSYQIKKDNDIRLKAKKSNYTSTEYEFNDDGISSYANNIDFASDKFINPRIEKTKDREKLYTMYTYDDLGRTKSKIRLMNPGENAKNLKVAYEYKPGTTLKNKITYETSSRSPFYKLCGFDYAYNSRGLISNETTEYRKKDGNYDTYEKKYTYDIGNRLISETENNLRTNYFYNTDGTLSRIENNSFTIRYIHKNGRLKEMKCNQINSFNKTFSYDNMGNCVRYGNNTLSWERGKLLKKFVNDSNEISYKYDNEGLLIEKNSQDNTKCHEYIYEHGKLIKEKIGEKILLYIYDKDEIIGFSMSTGVNSCESYYYMKDVTGNVISIRGELGEYGKYGYDSWGNTFIEEDPYGILEINPIRWKSQYYDDDLKMYYINKRFYSPEIGQYICPENIESVVNNQFTLYALNLYTLNAANPINLMYNSNTICDNCGLGYDPEQLSDWDRFWKTEKGKTTSVILSLAAITFMLIAGTFINSWFSIKQFIVGIVSALAIDGILYGIISMDCGNSFWRGFANFINEEWSVTIAMESVTTILLFGVTLSILAVLKSRNKNNISAKVIQMAKQYGVEIQFAEKEYFTDEAWEKINNLKHREDGSTISDLKTGREIHNGFMVDIKGKELRLPGSKKRADHLDKNLKIIRELKPRNEKSAIKGIKQISNYNAIMGGNYRLILILY